MKRFIFGLLFAGTAAITAACGRAGDGTEAPQAHIFGGEKNLLEEIQEEGKLVIGISADYAPFAFTVEGEDGSEEYRGSDIELGKYMGEQLGVQVEFREMDMEDCLEAVKAGTVDMVLLGMLPEAGRLGYVDFTDPYYQPGRQVLLIEKAQKSEYTELEDFEGKSVAAQYGTLQAQLVIEQLTKSYMELVDTVSEGIEMLNNGRVDAVALDEQATDDILKEYSSLTLASVELEYEQEGVVGGVVEREPEFLAAVNQVMDQVREDGLYLEWMDAAIQQAAAASSIPEASPQGSSAASPAVGSD